MDAGAREQSFSSEVLVISPCPSRPPFNLALRFPAESTGGCACVYAYVPPRSMRRAAAEPRRIRRLCTKNIRIAINSSDPKQGLFEHFPGGGHSFPASSRLLNKMALNPEHSI